jgi:hypothetical protein
MKDAVQIYVEELPRHERDEIQKTGAWFLRLARAGQQDQMRHFRVGRAEDQIQVCLTLADRARLDSVMVRLLARVLPSPQAIGKPHVHHRAKRSNRMESWHRYM